jgi:hypothetical protein
MTKKAVGGLRNSHDLLLGAHHGDVVAQKVMSLFSQDQRSDVVILTRYQRSACSVPKTGGAGFLALFFTAARYTYQARAALVIGA